MDMNGEDGLAGWLVDGGAATWFAGAAGFATIKLAPVMWVLPLTSLGFGAAIVGLRLASSGRKRFRLPSFAAQPMKFDILVEELLLTELAEQPQMTELLASKLAPGRASRPGRSSPFPRCEEPLGELLLDDELPRADEDLRVVQLFKVQPLPTAGELGAKIDAHLRQASPLRAAAKSAEPPVSEEVGGANVHRLNPDASAALHHALADLRRNLSSRRA